MRLAFATSSLVNILADWDEVSVAIVRAGRV